MTDDRQVSGPPRGNTSSANTLLVGVLVVLTATLAYQTWSNSRNSNEAAQATYAPRDVTPKGLLGADEQATISVFQQSSPSVVFIRTKGFQPVFYGRTRERELSSGTGFVWDQAGHIVTNLHVVEEVLKQRGATLEVQFADQSVVDAEVIGGVREFDVAVLKVNASLERLKPLLLGTSGDLDVGQRVLAIGSPFGFDQTLSTGVIGGLRRSVAAEGGKGVLSGLIQTDAAINPGNSGGPLLDSSGRLIGVNTAIVSPTGTYAGLGFAVPVDEVKSSVDRVLSQTGSEPKAALGLSVLLPEDLLQLGLSPKLVSRGLFIKQVDPNGPAATAGLLPTGQERWMVFLGDQITAVEGTAVTTPQEFENALAEFSPGDVVTIEFYRELVQRMEARVRLQTEKQFF